MFEALVIDWLKIASTRGVATNLRVSWNAVDGIVKRGVTRRLARRDAQAPTRLAVDEVSFQRRHEYVTVVTDQETGAVIHLVDDRTRESLEEYFASCDAEDLAAIESVSMDMWPAYIGAVREFVPEADKRICVDTFHVAKHLGDAVNVAPSIVH